MPPNTPFKVVALYEYTSEEPDDLTFPVGQVITVDVVEDAEWYSGNYTDPSTGSRKSGLFPISFVQAVAEESKPVRRAPAPPVAVQPKEEEEVVPAAAPASAPAPAPVPAPTSPTLRNQPSGNSSSAPPVISPTSTGEGEANTAPKKRNAFADRIAAFNAGNSTEAPSPFNQPKPVSYAKKPFYAVPTNSYVPHIPSVPKPAPPPAQSAPTVSASEVVHYNDANEDDEPAVPNVSLKDRIKLLQQQQAAEAARAEALATKKKAKKEKSRKMSEDPLEPVETGGSLKSSGHADTFDSELDPTVTRGSLEGDRDLPVVPESEANLPASTRPRESFDSTHSGVAAPEEGATEESKNEEEDVEEAEEEEEDEEDEEDEEEARRLALRQRMAKISGGMGMVGMGGMGMPGMMGFGGMPPSAPPKKTKKKTEEEPVEARQAPVPILPFEPAAAPPPPAKISDPSDVEEDEEDESLSPPASAKTAPSTHGVPPPAPPARAIPPQPPVRAAPPQPPAHQVDVVPSPPARALTSVIDAHKEDSDAEESDSAWSDSNTPAAREITPTAPQAPAQAPLERKASLKNSSKFIPHMILDHGTNIAFK